MIAKIINENQITVFPGYFIENDTVYTNKMAEEKALISGQWFEVIEDEKPECNENECFIVFYELLDGSIKKRWKKEVIPNENIID